METKNLVISFAILYVVTGVAIGNIELFLLMSNHDRMTDDVIYYRLIIHIF
jgi:hypothetical protein